MAQGTQIALHHGLDIGVDRGGGAALVLAALGQHFRRQRHRHPGQALAQILSEAEFVLRKGVRVQQAYGHGLYPLGFEPLAELLKFSLFEGH